MKSLEEMGITKNIIMINAVMVFGGFITFLNGTLLTPAYPSIMRGLQIDATTVQWLTTGFMLVNGIMIPVTAYLLDRFTTRKLFFAAMGVFTVGTTFSALAPSFSVLLFGRLLQAAGAGVMMPMGQTITLLTLPKQYRGVGMGIIGLVMNCAPAIGPVISGLIVDRFNWHTLFYVILPLSVLTMIVAYFYLENLNQPKDVRLDIPSVILSTLGFGGLLYSFSTIGSYGFNNVVLLSLLIGIAALALFIHRQLQMDEPLLNVRTLTNKKFAVSVILTMLINAAFVVGTVLNPIYIQTLRGFPAIASGLMMLPAAVTSIILSPVSGRLFDKYGARILAIPGLALVTIFTIPLVMMGEETSLVFLAIIYCFRSVGLALVNMPLNTWGLNALHNNVIAHGTAIGNTFRQVAGSLGTAILITVMSIVVAASPVPDSITTQIHGINMAYLGAGLMMAVAWVLTLIFVKED